MATVNFRLRKIKGINYPILVYLSQGVDKPRLETKTGFYISSDRWSNPKKKPKGGSEEEKKLGNDLDKLKAFIFEEYNKANSEGLIINNYWLKNCIDKCFNRYSIEDEKNNLITFQTQHIIDNAKTKKIKGTSRIGLSKNRVKGYVTFLNMMKRYETEKKKKFRLTDVNTLFVENFINWMMSENDYSKGYTGKQVDNLKAVGLDAKRREIRINPYIPLIESFKESKENRFIVTLTFDDLNTIRSANLKKDYLLNTRKWLLLGCEIGQRGSDLMNISKGNIRYSNNLMLLDVLQEKTKKTVTLPIIRDDIEQFLKNDFPRKVSLQKLNDYVKELCKVVGINEPTKGKLKDPFSNRVKVGIFPKYKLITSHSFRRSFATNYYKVVPTPVLMEITAHSKESMFLDYINKPKDRDANAELFVKLVNENLNANNPKLKIV